MGPHKKPCFTQSADKHLLYQLAVQDAVVECDFVDRVFRKIRGRTPKTLLENFCGTALVCSEWVKRGPSRAATGIDINPTVLAWGAAHNLAKLGETGRRVTLLCQDVRDPIARRFDAVSAMNFSYWIFRTREQMRAYFSHVRRLLGKRGIFVIDAYGGWEAQQVMQERRRVKGGFTYVWDQQAFDPITHEVVNYIHFELRDGRKLRRAFEYRWRFWTLPELCELLAEAGFSDVRVYWDISETDRDEEDYRPRKHATNHPGWLAYLVAAR